MTIAKHAGVQRDVNTSRKRRRRDADIRSAAAAAARRSAASAKCRRQRRRGGGGAELYIKYRQIFTLISLSESGEKL